VFISAVGGYKGAWGRVVVLSAFVLNGVRSVAGVDPLSARILFVVFAGGVIVLVFYAATRVGR